MNKVFKTYILERIHFLFAGWIGFLGVGLLLGHYLPQLVVIINLLIILYAVFFGFGFWFGVRKGFKKEKKDEQILFTR